MDPNSSIITENQAIEDDDSVVSTNHDPNPSTPYHDCSDENRTF